MPCETGADNVGGVALAISTPLRADELPAPVGMVGASAAAGNCVSRLRASFALKSESGAPNSAAARSGGAMFAASPFNNALLGWALLSSITSTFDADFTGDLGDGLPPREISTSPPGSGFQTGSSSGKCVGEGCTVIPAEATGGEAA